MTTTLYWRNDLVVFANYHIDIDTHARTHARTQARTHASKHAHTCIRTSPPVLLPVGALLRVNLADVSNYYVISDVTVTLMSNFKDGGIILRIEVCKNVFSMCTLQSLFQLRSCNSGVAL